MNSHDSRSIWKNGMFVPWQDGVVHALSPAMMGGLTVFEDVPCLCEDAGTAYAFRLDEHLERLLRSAKIALLDVPYTARKLRSAVLQVMEREGRGRAAVRIMAYNESGGAAFCPGDDPATVIVARLGDTDARRSEADLIEACISSWRGVSSDVVPAPMNCTAVESVLALARQDAAMRNADEAVLLDAQGNVCRSTGGAVFAVRDGVVSTPPASSGAYDSVARDTVLNLAMDMDVPVMEESLTRSDLFIADEVFLVDDARGMTGVSRVDGRQVGKGSRGPVLEALHKRFAKLAAGKLPEYQGWLAEVPNGAEEGGR